MNALHRPEGVTLKRVDSANPDPTASYLWRKLTACCPTQGTAGETHVHIYGFHPSAQQLETIRLWITQGARRE